MEPITLIFVIIGVLVLTIFNYFLNLAPGSDPEDFAIGPPQLNITCDCSLNTLILGGILVVALSAASSVFDSRTELYITGGIAFAIVTIAGIMGRRRRHVEWKSDEHVIRRAIQKDYQIGRSQGPVDIIFDDEEDEFDYDDY